MSTRESFYTDHWREIEDERITRYEQMFVWRDQQLVLLEGAELKPGQRVLDIGCGPGFFAGGWTVLVAPNGTPEGIIRKVSADIQKVQANPEFIARLGKLGAYLTKMTPQDVQAFVNREQETWRPVLEKLAPSDGK